VTSKEALRLMQERHAQKLELKRILQQDPKKTDDGKSVVIPVEIYRRIRKLVA
jgi:Arc/MetJ-type ribon-helix-helix transcriptional regulator